MIKNQHNKERVEPKRVWVKPELQRIEAGSAEGGPTISVDGFSSS